MGKLYTSTFSKADKVDIIDMTKLRNPSTIDILVFGEATIACSYLENGAWIQFFQTSVTASVSCPIADTIKIEQVSGSSTTCEASISQQAQGATPVTAVESVTGGIGFNGLIVDMDETPDETNTEDYPVGTLFVSPAE